MDASNEAFHQRGISTEDVRPRKAMVRKRTRTLLAHVHSSSSSLTNDLNLSQLDAVVFCSAGARLWDPGRFRSGPLKPGITCESRTESGPAELAMRPVPASDSHWKVHLE